jgi:5-methylcytosine-specific restriction endonuclease McrA
MTKPPPDILDLAQRLPRPCARCGEWVFPPVRCIPCGKVRKRKEYLQDKEKIKNRTRVWRAANPDRKRAADRAWRAKNAEVIRARFDRWYAVNGQSVRDRARAWVKAHPELARAQKRLDMHNRYQREKAAADGSLTEEFLKTLYATADCYYCRQPTPQKQRTLEHRLPLARGGAHSADNAVMACFTCNMAKGPKTEEEFVAWITNANGISDFCG